MKIQKSDPLIHPFQDRYADYLTDESRASGKAESISFPQKEAQVQAIVNTLSKQQIPITVQGSRTGITGGAIPVRGHIMTLSKMNRVIGMEQDSDGQFLIRVQPGVTLSELNHQLNSQRFDNRFWNQKALDALDAFQKAGRLFWPPDPSEDSASVGGIAAGNSRGICAHYYGPARDHIQQIRVVVGSGQIYAMARGEYLFSNGVCPLPGGATIHADPTGLDPFPTMDLMDLHLGSQGMFGVITELTLSLKSLPKELWGIVFFFEVQSQAIDFIQSISQPQRKESDTAIVAIEFMDQTTLACIREFKQKNTRMSHLPEWDNRFVSAVYVEIHGNRPGEIDPLSEWLLENAVTAGSDPDATWAACGMVETDQLRLFRRAAPEAVNQFIDTARLKDPRIIKLGTDMRLNTSRVSELIDMYGRDLKTSGLKAAIFGHAADGHLHVNILPRDYPQFESGSRLIKNWAETISAKGGSVVTEHGAGKIKKKLFRSIPLPQNLKIIRCLKQQLDPDGLWNPGNMPDS